MNVLSFGDINSLLSHMKVGYQTQIARYWGKDYKFLISAMSIIRMFRNACAHNETIYNFKTFGYRLNSNSIQEFLNYFNITDRDKNNHYKSGTNDLLALFFIFKIMLPKKQFKEFIEQYLSIFNNLLMKGTSKVNDISIKNIIKEINIYTNIKDLTKL
jgi:abortive infection bacteriophage resistance protein